MQNFKAKPRTSHKLLNLDQNHPLKIDFFGQVLINYDVITLFQINFISRRPGEANFADIIKITIMLIKATYKDQSANWPACMLACFSCFTRMACWACLKFMKCFFDVFDQGPLVNS